MRVRACFWRTAAAVTSTRTQNYKTIHISRVYTKKIFLCLRYVNPQMEKQTQYLQDEGGKLMASMVNDSFQVVRIQQADDGGWDASEQYFLIRFFVPNSHSVI